MLDKLNISQLTKASVLSREEASVIDEKVKIELNTIYRQMLKSGGIANIVSGVLVLFILWNSIAISSLITWYIVLVFINLTSIGLAFYKKDDQINIKKWLFASHSVLFLICLTWALAYILFIPNEIRYQFFMTALLIAVLVGFSFGTITDFKATIISIGALLVPYVFFRVYHGIHFSLHNLPDLSMNLGFGLCVLIFGLFMLVACFVGNALIKKTVWLTFVNVALQEKLKKFNEFLERRVKDRTMELNQSLEVVRYQATHDLLTDLPNHRLLVESIEESIVEANQKNEKFAIAFFGLNEMDKINDGLGDQASALTIKTIAIRLQKEFGKSKAQLSTLRYIITLSRRDRFIVLLKPIDELKQIDDWAEICFSVLDQPIYVDKKAIKLTSSIGVSTYPKDGKDVKSLLMTGDAAMLQAKKWGGNRLVIYQSEIDSNITKQLEIETHLHDALKNNEFRLNYQPFIDLKTGKICGMEALLRWKNSVLGFVSPMDFIPLAEANGLILSIGEWVLRTACAQVKTWHELGFRSLKIAINLSAKQLQQDNIVDMVAEVLKKSDLQPEHIELEMTETEFFKESTTPILKKIKSMGVGFAIDDFGTGYSGLQSLKLFSVDKLKIDKSFVQDIENNEYARSIIVNTIALAKRLGIAILAEGVETQEQLKFLFHEGCDMIQGFYFSSPITPDDLTELLINKKCLSLDDL